MARSRSTDSRAAWRPTAVSTLRNNTLIEGNTIEGGRVGVEINAGKAQLVGNKITGMSEAGITVVTASPTLADNELCGSATDLFLGSGAEPTLEADNEVCVTDSVE